MEFTGEFETHLTVRLGEAESTDRLRDWSAGRGLKCTHIVLARGRTASQPMLTRYGRGALSAEVEAAKRLSDDLAGEGFEVSRIKIEAAPGNRDVPRTDDEAAHHPRDRYFEHHVKLLLDAIAGVDPVTSIAQRHQAHVSRNALRVRADGRHERFVTQRCHGVGSETAHRKLDALLNALTEQRYEVIDVEQEFVVYDSDLTIDAGWIQPEGQGT
jgi:hypothetical protein